MPDIHTCKFVSNNVDLVLRGTQYTFDLNTLSARHAVKLTLLTIYSIGHSFPCCNHFKYNTLSTKEVLCIYISPVYKELGTGTDQALKIEYMYPKIHV